MPRAQMLITDALCPRQDMSQSAASLVSAYLSPQASIRVPLLIRQPLAQICFLFIKALFRPGQVADRVLRPLCFAFVCPC